MIKAQFVALHGEEAYNALIKHPTPNVEMLTVASGLESNACEHGHRLIGQMLRLIGLPEVSTILQAKEIIERTQSAVALQRVRDGEFSGDADVD